MKKEVTVTGFTKDGKEIKVKITMNKEVVSKKVNADGEMIEIGLKTNKTIEIVMYLNGEIVAKSSTSPKLITKESHGRHYDQLKSNGAYAQLNDKFISEDIFNKITNAIKELEEQTETNEFKAMKESEEIKKINNMKEMEVYNKSRNNVLNAIGY